MTEGRKKIVTYGRVKNWKSMVRVLLFTAALIVIVAVLTIARGIIFEDGSASDSSGENLLSSKGIIVENGEGLVRITNGGGARFETMGYDISGLLNSDMVKDLPKKAVIELKLGEEYYAVTKDSISAGRPSNPDLTISLPAHYANQIAFGLCSMVKKASDNGDLSMEMHSSQAALMWKYKNMLKYKNCLG